VGVFNLFNHFDPRDVQNNVASARFGGFFNSSWREYRGKFVLEFDDETLFPADCFVSP